MMEQKYSDIPMLEMVSLSEEINMLNFKLKEYIELLPNDKAMLDNVKKLGGTIEGKVVTLVGMIDNYKFTELPEPISAIPSYISENQPKVKVTTDGTTKEEKPLPDVKPALRQSDIKDSSRGNTKKSSTTKATSKGRGRSGRGK